MRQNPNSVRLKKVKVMQKEYPLECKKSLSIILGIYAFKATSSNWLTSLQTNQPACRLCHDSELVPKINYHAMHALNELKKKNNGLWAM